MTHVLHPRARNQHCNVPLSNTGAKNKNQQDKKALLKAYFEVAGSLPLVLETLWASLEEKTQMTCPTAINKGQLIAGWGLSQQQGTLWGARLELDGQRTKRPYSLLLSKSVFSWDYVSPMPLNFHRK